jgi:energy-coupling factor transporter ATP-binding protein EcfA2
MARSPQVLEEAELLERMARLAEAFRPAAPIDRRGLFSGRVEQIGELFSVVGQPGQHAVVYGERGVGKTSLTTVVAELLRGSNVATVRVICDSSDDFSSIWRKALGEIGLRTTTSGVGFAPIASEGSEPASVLLGSGPVTPYDVMRALESLATERSLAIFVDEFDRIVDPDDRALFAETIKTLSDRIIRATIVLVGVADDVDELIRGHRSIERALVQIRMPRMSRSELAEIATKGIEAAQMTIQKTAVDSVTGLSQGLPHYTHLLTQLAGQAALSARRAKVESRDMDAAVERALDRAGQSVAAAYHRAVEDEEGRRRQVLLACALAQEDEFGFFSTADVEGPLGRIGSEPLEEEALSGELDGLARGPEEPVLQRGGVNSRRYRFANPLLQPYVVMRGLSEGLVKARDVR